MPKAKRAVILGLDALVPTIFEKFLAEGSLPNLKTLYDRGSYCPVLPVIPAQTPSNWTTIATGATPGTHGVFVWGTHKTGEPLTQTYNREAFCSGICRAEYLWEAAARAGRHSVVVYYAGYPPTTDKAIHIDWLYSPGAFYFEISRAMCYTNLDLPRNPTKVAFAKAEGWRNLPDSKREILATSIELNPSLGGTGVKYQGLIIAAGDNGYDTLLLTKNTDASSPVALMKAGQWSEWQEESFVIDGNQRVVSFRFKLVELSGDASRFRLYRSQVYPTDGGFIFPNNYGQELVEKFGPYVNESAAHYFHEGWLDFDTAKEELLYQARWLAGASRYTMDKYDGVLHIQHWHPLDYIGHMLMSRIDPAGMEYDPEHLEQNWQEMRQYYQLADQLVGEFMKQFDVDDTAFVIVADHGMPSNNTAVSLFTLFRNEGLIKVKGEGDAQQVDWDNSALYYTQNHLWLNVKGREPNGVVDPEDYHHVRCRIIRLMRSLTHPDTGDHVIPVVLPKEDAPIVGLWGQDIGDVVFLYAGGCRWTGPEVMRMGEDRVIFPSGGANHGPQLTTYETKVSSNYGVLLMSGAGIRHGYQRDKSSQGPVITTDIAPTVAHLVGIPTPAQSEGKVLLDFLEDAISAPERKYESLPSHPPIPGPTRATLKGDVTDEV